MIKRSNHQEDIAIINDMKRYFTKENIEWKIST